MSELPLVSNCVNTKLYQSINYLVVLDNYKSYNANIPPESPYPRASHE